MNNEERKIGITGNKVERGREGTKFGEKGVCEEKVRFNYERSHVRSENERENCDRK